ncbi:MAG TPA: aminotransferase class V-fold PLP-dependent enzyme [Pyrinomonadaceae bacterium]|nr:aminotransferase class V-fold PLP-dependent enzyme [Pyrinomonadaceae bacterium]
MTPELRALFPITERLVYLNHAAVSPLPTPTIKATEAQLHDVFENGSMHFRQWLSVKEEARRLLASLLGARPEQVAFMRNTSDSLSTVANGLRWNAGDNVVTFRHEFPSNIYPWLRLRDTHGVEIRMCGERNGRVDQEELCNLIDKRTRLVAISQVQFATGFRANMARLAEATRQKDALLVVDVIQGLGVVPTNVEQEGIDVAAGAGHKWLLTPEGVGYLYLSDRARERIEPTLVGWVSVQSPEDYDNFDQQWNRCTLAWETGTGPNALIHGLKASLELLASVGTKRISNYLEEVTDYLCERLEGLAYDLVSSRTPEDKSQIVCIKHRHGLSSMELYHRLAEQNIITAPRGDRLRIAPHFYNNHEDIDRLLSALSRES